MAAIGIEEDYDGQGMVVRLTVNANRVPEVEERSREDSAPFPEGF